MPSNPAGTTQTARPPALAFLGGRQLQPAPARAALQRTGASRREALLGAFCPCCCGVCKPKDGWYDRFFAGAIATGMDSYEQAVAPFKWELLRNAASASDSGERRVLEVGIGAAPNLQYLTSPTQPQDSGLRVVGVDPNPYMFGYARERAAAVGLPADALDLHVGVAEALPVESGAFDTVICTLVLCSVPDVAGSVAEMRRALRPGGRLLFLEHVLAPPQQRLLRLSQRALNPLQQLLADGCHLDRNPLPAFEAAGFASLQTQAFTVPGMGPIGPHVSGIATA